MYSKIDPYNLDQSTENPVTVKFYNALTAPLQQRCGELTILFDRAPAKDLKSLFPVLIERIFTWNLRSIDPSHRDFTILHHFLAPLGPVFRLIYKLLTDSFIRYEYPISQVPMTARNKPFYNDLLGPDGNVLLMNPFDYYMYQFGWHLMAPQRMAAWNTVYYVLSCDYLTHFLPTDNSVPVPHVGSQFTGKNTLHHPIQNRNSTPTSKLFRPQVIQSVELINLNASYQQQHPRSEIWRSETVIQVFVDIWLSNDFVNHMGYDLPYASHTFYDLPSGEYIRIIRFGIKQLYAFVDSADHDVSPSAELKKNVLPMIQGKMYLFLRHLIQRWPLDGSFRLLLELWLTFIQPWRYPASYFQRDDKSKREDDIPEIDSKYLRFIADNLLSYTQIFQQLLPRFLRIDLTSPKEAILIYRVTKVFAQPNLTSMLREVESSIDSTSWSRRDYLHTTNARFATIVSKNIFDLEGPDFWYSPMFTKQTSTQIVQLLQNLQIAVSKVKTFLIEKEETLKKSQGGFWRGFFMMTETWDDEFSIEERRKVPDYLESAQANLMNIFELNMDTISKSFDASLPSEANNSTNNITNQSFLNISTPDEARKRAANIRYQGDPDLLPPRSSECTVLVNILHSTSKKINEMYGCLIADLYNRPGLYGAFARQFIEPPRLITTYDKSYTGGIVSPRVQRLLPPRISLRVCAQNKVVYTVVLSFLFCLIFGYDYGKLLTFVFFGINLYIFCKAFYHRNDPISHGYLDDSISSN